MILVAGGQLDPNIGALLRRMLWRKTVFADLLVGPELLTRIFFDLGAASLEIDGRVLVPTSCFVRHDVFGQQAKKPMSGAAALGWFYAMRGWALSRDDIRLFNRFTAAGEGSKLQHLVHARKCGFAVPPTVVSNAVGQRLQGDWTWISKPVGGGQYTAAWYGQGTEDSLDMPAIFQRRMLRPELRVYRIGDELFGFSIECDDLDYRNSAKVNIAATGFDDADSRFMSFCSALGLDFAAADFMRDPETGELVFLEINTQPMFVAFDRLVDGRMCDAIIDWLEPTQG